MDSSSLIYAQDVKTDDRLSKLQLLESGYLDSLQKEDSIVKDETARRLRLQILILEEENDELHEQLALEDDRVDVLECERIELQAQIEQAELDTQNYHAELRVKDRELANVKAELLSMNGLSKDSTKLLTEKLLLARELASIKPELEHLRSQASHQQTLLSEKLALQRQVSTLEVELETANVKNSSSSKRAASRDIELQTELEELKQELSREKSEREKYQKAAECESSEWESRRAVLESKIDAMRTKLRATKEQLKEVQAQLAQTIATASKVSIAPETRDAPAHARKRGATQMSDTTIGTPDGIAVRGKRGGGKRRKPDQTSFGEKSMFSITPYLNRTVNMQPETPKDIQEAIVDSGASGESAAADAENGDAENIGVPVPVTQMDVSPSMTAKPKPVVKPSRKAALKELKTDSKNNGAAIKKPRVTKLEKVPEEDANENEDPTQKTVPTLAKHRKNPILPIPAVVVEEAEPKKKRRKLLGLNKTIFDEDDGEATRRPAKVILPPARSLGKLGGKRDATSNGLNAPIAGFGAFSPLKKDKRGAQASFLG